MGDQVLREMAQILVHTFNDKVVVSRYGGEEFLVVLPNTEHDQAMALAEQLREKIAEHVVMLKGSAVLQITASMGLYTLVYDQLQRIKQDWSPVDANMVKDNWNINLKAHASFRSLQLNGHYRTKPRLDKRALLNFNQQQLELFAHETCNSMISTADKALYKAKESGRNCVLSANILLATGVIHEPRHDTSVSNNRHCP